MRCLAIIGLLLLCSSLSWAQSGVYDDTLPPLNQGDSSSARLSKNRATHVNLRDDDGNQLGTSAHPIVTTSSPSGAATNVVVTNTSPIPVDASGSTVSVTNASIPVTQITNPWLSQITNFPLSFGATQSTIPWVVAMPSPPGGTTNVSVTNASIVVSVPSPVAITGAPTPPSVQTVAMPSPPGGTTQVNITNGSLVVSVPSPVAITGAPTPRNDRSWTLSSGTDSVTVVGAPTPLSTVAITVASPVPVTINNTSALPTPRNDRSWTLASGTDSVTVVGAPTPFSSPTTLSRTYDFNGNGITSQTYFDGTNRGLHMTNATSIMGSHHFSGGADSVTISCNGIAELEIYGDDTGATMTGAIDILATIDGSDYSGSHTPVTCFSDFALDGNIYSAISSSTPNIAPLRCSCVGKYGYKLSSGGGITGTEDVKWFGTSQTNFINGSTGFLFTHSSMRDGFGNPLSSLTIGGIQALDVEIANPSPIPVNGTVGVTGAPTPRNDRSWTLASGTDSVTVVGAPTPFSSPFVNIANTSALPTPFGSPSVLVQSSNTDISVTPGGTPSKATLIGGIYSSPAPSPSPGQAVALQVDGAGRLISAVTNTVTITGAPTPFSSPSVNVVSMPVTHIIVDSGALNANQSTNIAQMNGITTLMDNGATGTGAQRVTVSNNSLGTFRMWDGTNIATVTAANALKTDNSAVTQPANVSQVGGNTTLTDNGATGSGAQRITVSNNSLGTFRIWDGTNIATVTTGNALKTDGSAVTQPSSLAAASISGSNPCMNPTATLVGISGATTGTAATQIIAASGSTKIYVCSASITGVSGTTPTFSLVTGTGSNCASSQVTFLGAWTTAANTVYAFANPVGVTPSSSEICYKDGGTLPIQNYNITYVQQ